MYAFFLCYTSFFSRNVQKWENATQCKRVDRLCLLRRLTACMAGADRVNGAWDVVGQRRRRRVYSAKAVLQRGAKTPDCRNNQGIYHVLLLCNNGHNPINFMVHCTASTHCTPNRSVAPYCQLWRYWALLLFCFRRNRRSRTRAKKEPKTHEYERNTENLSHIDRQGVFKSTLAFLEKLYKESEAKY